MAARGTKRPRDAPSNAWPGLQQALSEVVKAARDSGEQLTKTIAVVRALRRTPCASFAVNTTPERRMIGQLTRALDYEWASGASRRGEKSDERADIAPSDVRGPPERVARSPPPQPAELRARLRASAHAGWLEELTSRGAVRLPGVLTPGECARTLDAFAAANAAGTLPPVTRLRESKGNGSNGFYCYYADETVASVRQALYDALVDAHASAGPSNGAAPHAPRLPPLGAGGARDASILLAYGAGGENFAHRDQAAFPLQAVVLLSRPGLDFDGGGCLYVVRDGPPFDRHVVPWGTAAGDAVLFCSGGGTRSGAGSPTAERAALLPNVRHGMTRIGTGQRVALGICFNGR